MNVHIDPPNMQNSIVSYRKQITIREVTNGWIVITDNGRQIEEKIYTLWGEIIRELTHLFD